jgi:hypothetical protein
MTHEFTLAISRTPTPNPTGKQSKTDELGPAGFQQQE